MQGRLDGKVVLLSGAARGQGAAEARLCAREGAAVVLGDVRVQEGAAVAEEILGAGGRARFVELDVTRRDQWDRAVACAVEQFGALHGLVNNAAILATESVEQTTPETWARVIAVNQTGPLLGMQAALPALRRARGGSIVNVSSVMAFLGGEGGGGAAYGATKGALTTLSRAAAMEWAQDGIRVNSLHPGAIDTPMADEGSPDPAARSALASMSPLAREGTADEVAWAALFLLSDEASFVTGSALVVDGGWSTH